MHHSNKVHTRYAVVERYMLGGANIFTLMKHKVDELLAGYCSMLLHVFLSDLN